MAFCDAKVADSSAFVNKSLNFWVILFIAVEKAALILLIEDFTKSLVSSHMSKSRGVPLFVFFSNPYPYKSPLSTIQSNVS